jgi:hypothetical protein
VEAQHLDSLAERVPSKPLAEHLGGAAGEDRIGVRLDLELESDRFRQQLEQFLQ